MGVAECMAARAPGRGPLKASSAAESRDGFTGSIPVRLGKSVRRRAGYGRNWRCSSPACRGFKRRTVQRAWGAEYATPNRYTAKLKEQKKGRRRTAALPFSRRCPPASVGCKAGHERSALSAHASTRGPTQSLEVAEAVDRARVAAPGHHHGNVEVVPGNTVREVRAGGIERIQRVPARARHRRTAVGRRVIQHCL